MKILNRKGRFFQDWSVKMLCLVCAIVIYFMIGYVSFAQRVVEIPLELKLPQGYYSQNIVPSSISLKMEGENSIIYLIAPNEIKAICDFSQVPENILEESIQKKEPLEAKVNLIYDTGIIKVGSELTFTVEPDAVKVLFKRGT